MQQLRDFNCIDTIGCLAAYFSWTDIEVIQRKFVARTWFLGAVLAKWILDDASRKAACPHFSILHDKMEGLADMQKSVQLAFAKPIKDGRILLKIRPQMAYQSEWNEAFAVLDGLECSERKTVAPPGALVRDLRRR